MGQLINDQLVKTVIEDIKYLRDDWNDEIDDASLRRGSVVLRRLLINHDLQRAWTSLGMGVPLTIEAVSLRMVLKSVAIKNIYFASAGGAKYKGATVARFFMAKGSAPLQRSGSSSAPSKEIFGIKQFLRSPCLIVKGQEVQRGELVEYVANKMGGAHFDSERHDGDINRLMDEVMGEGPQILNKKVIFYELLAIGQAVAESENIKSLYGNALRFL